MVLFSSLLFTAAILGHAQAIRYLGRVNPGTKELTWPGTGVSFTFTGTSAKIVLSAVSGTNSVELTVDGVSTVIPNVEGTAISTPQGLSAGKHTVILRKRSEASFGTLTIGNVTTDGKLGADVPPKNRKIEIIGDSISVGYGLDGVLPCANTAAVQNNPKTYGPLAAADLNADYSVVAWSGKGITRNYVTTTPDTSPLISQLYTRYGANDADNSYTFPSAATPQAVILNIGTNDFSYISFNSTGQPYPARAPLDPPTYTAALVKFVQTIRKRYSNAHFFLLNSPMLNDDYPSVADAQKTTQTKAIQAAITQLNNNKIHFVNWPTQGSDVGCDYHPNAATNAAEAKILAAAIRSALQW